jgi:hypothetical protein
MAIWLRFREWIIAVGAAMAALVGIYMYGKHSGSLKEMQRQMEKDRDTARKIEDAADRARRSDGDNVDPVERLRQYKRLRDL